ncbi:unnamed protein product [Arctia plantaginis]|uniref:Glycoside hydrolase family 38 central domain-containing protein n=1 Tax=Arctia plantaginis TaxID=874455 RepID=A0A8S1BEF5_ARCPL|nr:unnamed protein product [Arctia plantaginis]
MSNKLYVLIILSLEIKCTLSEKLKIECGYKQCPQTRDGALNVHLIPHSHMDAGWVKTFDQYYYGTKTTISTANVQLIYHSVLSELLHDKRRKFTFSETAYFWRWWKEQRPTTRATFRTLVQEGRVEFAGGGWVNNDEATPDYLHIIDQFTWGLRKINDTLGPCGKPKAAWQIDTYGHTREQVSLLAQMGYDGLFIGKMSDIMTHTLFNLYNAPEGFCFDFLCNDEPIIDDPDNKVYNADKRVNDFITQIERQAKYYDHDNIMVTMGGDFTYQSAANWFMNMDKLINHVNTHPANISDINIFYSTPSCYLKAIYLYGRRDKAVFTEKGDHLPYGSDLVTYWTGYYSSRPSIKYLTRRAHVFLQVVKQLTVLAKMGDSYELHLLRHAVSLVLHHDAITGTSQQHVTNDFVRILTEAIDSCTKKVSNLLSFLTPTWGGSRRSKNNQQFIICHQLNMSQCRFTESQESMLLVVYNPLSIKTYHHVRLPAIALHYSIRDYNDEEVEYQLVPLPAAIINLPGRSSTAIQELYFEAENIPPLGFTAYYISPVRDQMEENEYHKKSAQGKIEAEQEIIPFISNEYLKVSVDKNTGLLESITHVDGLRIDISQNFYYYSQAQQPLQSGAYSFRPDKPRPVPVAEKVSYNTIRGSLIKEIRQRYTDWITQIIRLYRGEEYVELEWVIGPVPIGTDLGKEVVTLFNTNITSAGEFFTDSNSRQMIRRSCWNETAFQQNKKPIAACYYPVTSRICIHSINTTTGLCVLTDRTQGGSSYNDGEIELMVHRRLLTDDGFGLEETLNEEAYGVGLVVKGKHRILFGNFRQEVDDLNFSERMSLAARKWLYEPWLFFTPGDKLNRRKWQNVRNKRFTALKLHGLPRHIHILTLEPWKAGSVLLRLENTLENPIRDRFKSDKSENPDDYTAKPSHITVELRKIFLQMQIKMVRETTLAANQWLDDARQMDWSTRYVYTGADDGMLTEDVEETKDKPSKQMEEQDSGHYSDEDQDIARRKQVNRQRFNAKNRARTKMPYLEREREYERRKRSINITENVMENIINDTLVDDFVNETTTIAYVKPSMDAKTMTRNVTAKVDDYYRIQGTQKTPKMNFLNRMKPTHLTQDFKADEAASSSEEDFSSNLKKRSPRRRNGLKASKRPKEEDTIIVDSDDGITKSMYDMYYRRPKPPPQSPHKKTERSSEEKNIRKKKKSRRYKPRSDSYDEPLERTTKRANRRQNKRRKGLTADMPFFINEPSRRFNRAFEEKRNRQKMMLEESMKETAKSWTQRSRSRKDSSGVENMDYSEEEELDNLEKEITDARTENNRRKRTLAKDDEAARDDPSSEPVEDPEFVVTLRPTQIRTFVIWFENTRKSFGPG